MSPTVWLPLLVPSTFVVVKHGLNIIGEKRAEQISNGGVYRISIASRIFVIAGACFITWLFSNSYAHGYILWPKDKALVLFFIFIIGFLWLAAMSSFFYRVRLTEDRIELIGFSTKYARYSEINNIRLVQGRTSRSVIVEYARSGRIRLSDQLQLFDKLYANLQDRVNKAHGIGGNAKISATSDV